MLLPTFDNAAHLRGVLEDVASLGRPVMVVDDGCTDSTQAVLDGFAADRPTVELIRILHETNLGKAAALKTGFAAARQRGYTHALSMDTDGQHRAQDAAKLLAASAAEPWALVIGKRDVDDPSYPSASRWGRLFSNLAIQLASGRRVADSQCGLRVYPLGLVEAVRCRAGRYGYEAEIITRSGWADCPLVEAPIATIYPPGDERVSHFRPIRDTAHGLGLHGRLLLRALWPWPHTKWPGKEALGQPRATGPRWKRALAWFDPRDLIEQVRRDRVGQMSVAAGLGIGGLVANLPVYPLQTVTSMYLAKRLHVHPLSAVLGSQIAFPPLNVLLIFSGVYIGHCLLWGSPPSFTDFSQTDWSSFAQVSGLMHEYFLAWWLGGVILGAGMGLAMFVAVLLLLRLVPVRATTTIEPAHVTEEFPPPLDQAQPLPAGSSSSMG